MNVPTDRRSLVKVLLRLGIPFDGAPVTRKIGGYTVMILGPAKPEDWPEYQPGDLEGMVWTTQRQVQQVVRNLTGVQGVVAARGEGDLGP
ncbi:MAG: hypothetical protein HYV09_08715 [Deltaproteobacteria bacterium]|nr:hypothetical protein [Deltaproteobacteria bacterium]